MDKDPHSLSGGYKRRLALAIQLVSLFLSLVVYVCDMNMSILGCLYFTSMFSFLIPPPLNMMGPCERRNVEGLEKTTKYFTMRAHTLMIIGCVQVQTPDLLILDEPLAGLGMCLHFCSLFIPCFHLMAVKFLVLYEL